MSKEESRDMHWLPVDPSSTGNDTYSVSKESRVGSIIQTAIAWHSTGVIGNHICNCFESPHRSLRTKKVIHRFVTTSHGRLGKRLIVRTRQTSPVGIHVAKEVRQKGQAVSGPRKDRGPHLS